VDDPSPSGRRSFLDRLFRDRDTGRIVVAQFPNAALWLFLATAVLRRIVDEDGTTFTVLRVIGLAALAWWAGDELVRGVNPRRRLLLGAGGLVLVALGTASWLS
jgi:hypothetical protein